MIKIANLSGGQLPNLAGQLNVMGISKLAIFFAGSMLFWMGCTKGSEHVVRPNIILILADDLGYSDLGCTGGEIPTPNLDRLAASGLLMPNFYNAAKCCPTRAALMTGLYPHQAGMGDMVEGRLKKDSTFLPAYQGWLSKQSVTIAEVLGQAGYHTYLSGKWHLGNDEPYWPENRGFERTFAVIHGAGSYFKDEPFFTEDQFHRIQVDKKKFEPDTGFYMTDAIADFALRFLQEKQDEEPFFLYLSFTAPHWPLHALPEDIEKFRGKYLQGWDALRKKRFEKMKKLGLLPGTSHLSPAYQDLQKPFLTALWDTLSPEEQETWDLRMAVYAAQIHAMDRGIGRIIDFLEKEHLLNNTLLFFLSDNGATNAAIYLASSWIAKRSGPVGTAASFDAYGAKWGNMSNTPFPLFKNYTTEGGIKTPLIVHFPKLVAPGTINSSYGHVIDIMATCLDVAGVSYPGQFSGQEILPMEGISLLPALQGKSLPDDRPICWEHQGNYAVRLGRWKLTRIRGAKDPGWDRLQLFDLKDDPSETKDLSSRQPEKMQELERIYDNWSRKVGVENFDSLILARSM